MLRIYSWVAGTGSFCIETLMDVCVTSLILVEKKETYAWLTMMALVSLWATTVRPRLASLTHLGNHQVACFVPTLWALPTSPSPGST